MTSQSRFSPRLLATLMAIFIAGIACVYWRFHRPPLIASGLRPEALTADQSLAPGTLSPGTAAAAAEGSPSPKLSKREQRLRQFIEANGREHVVVIRVTNSTGLRPGVLARDLMKQLGTRRHLATRPASTAIMAVRYDGEIDEAAKLISFGKVVSTDAERRLIRVDAEKGRSALPD